MHSLSSQSSLDLQRKPRRLASSRLGHLVGRSALVALCGAALACGEDDDGGPQTVPLADSGSLRTLTSGVIEIPTTVAVSQGVAWLAESQFNHLDFQTLQGDGMTGPFRLLGVPLAGGNLEYIELPPDFFPEGIASSTTGRLYVGSVAGGGIMTVGATVFDAVPFISAEEVGTSVYGIRVSSDSRQSMVWACTSDDNVVSVAGIDIATSDVVVRHTLPATAAGAAPFCNDIVQSPDGGALWVTESFGGRLFRIAAENLMTADSLELWLEADNLRGPAENTFGANGIALLEGNLYVANTDRGAIFRIDPSLDAPTPDDLRVVSLVENGSPVVLARPDGIAAISASFRPPTGALLIVENGLGVDGGKRLVQATLDPL